MQAATMDLTKLFAPSTRFEVPLFQRPYVWDQDKQWAPLWEDVQACAERLLDATPDNDSVPHFFGAIVVQFRASGGVTTKTVIDGQQRLATLQVLIAAARAMATRRDDKKAAQKLGVLLFLEDFLLDPGESRLKFVPTNADRTAFRLAVEEDVADESKVPGNESRRVTKAYAYFRQAIADWLAEDDGLPSDRKLDKLADTVRSLLRVVVIDLESPENAQAIFETMNARMTPLLAADLVKNYLLQRVPAAAAVSAYGKYWEQFDRWAWRREIGIGRAKRPRVDQYLGHWLTLRKQTELHWQELFVDFRKYAAETRSDPMALMADLHDMSRVYDAFDRFDKGSPEWLFFYRTDVMEVSTVKPLALLLFAPGGIEDVNERRVALRAVESWMVRRMLCRLSTKQYNLTMLTLLKLLGDRPSAGAILDFLAGLEGESQLWPDDARVRESLASQPYYTAITRPRLRMVLEALENELRRKYNFGLADWGRLSVEHVLPQDWEANWPLAANVPEPQARAERDSAKHRIGNLTLTPQAFNSYLSNLPWTVASGADCKRGLFQQHNVYMLNKELAEQAAWGEAQIADRGVALADLALKIWPSPAVLRGMV